MRKIKILTICLMILSFTSIKAMNPKMQNIHNQMFGTVKQKMASLGRTFYDLYKKSFFDVEISKKSNKSRIRNVKAYLNYIIMILDLPGNKGATIADLPVTPTGENLAAQTQEVLDGWGLELVNAAPPGKDANWLLRVKGAPVTPTTPTPTTLTEAITQATTAAKAVYTAIEALPTTDARKAEATTGVGKISDALTKAPTA